MRGHIGDKPRLARSGISYVNRILGTTFAPAGAFFLGAWRIDVIQAWVYFGLFVLFGISNIALLATHDMELLNERGKTRTDVLRADRIIVGLYLLLTHVIAPVAAGVELGRLHAGYHGMALFGVGIVLLVAAGLLENWATHANHFYERTIRLQTDRGQTVTTNGPYSLVRHPGYLSYILRFAALPLALGSVFAILPTAAGILFIVVRTKVEDALLLANLPGYKEYARRVKYRLLPLLW